MVFFKKMNLALIIADQVPPIGDLDQTLTSLGYRIDMCKEERDVIGKLSNSDYRLVLVMEDYLNGHPNIEKHIFYLPQKKRRNMLFILVSSHHKTLDSFIAFSKNFNVVMNVSDLPKFSEILNITVSRYNDLYRGFKKIQEKEEFL